MKAEIIMIGTELLLGQIQDTNATYIAQELATNGIDLYQKSTVGDNRARIMGVLDAGLSRSDVLICSGGLGPTVDDITRECIAELLGRPLEHREELEADLVAKFASINRRMSENNKKQAYLPKGAQAIPNPIGTAPGVLLEDERGVIICMPGVPSELKLMFQDQVLPYLRQKFGTQGVLHYRVLKVCGYGESQVDAKLHDLIEVSSNPSIGLLASPDVVRVRVAAKADSLTAASVLMQPLIDEIYARLPDMILGEDEETLEGVVENCLQKRAWKLAIWDGASGGSISQRLIASGSKSLIYSEIHPNSHIDPKKMLALAHSFALDSASESALVLSANPAENRTDAVFVTPEGDAMWEFGFSGQDAARQLRTAVLGLEHVRRFLIKKKGLNS